MDAPVTRLEALVRALEAEASPADRLPLLRDALEELARSERRLLELRDDTMVALSQQGWTLQQIAAALGVTRGRVHQILRARRPADGVAEPA